MKNVTEWRQTKELNFVIGNFTDTERQKQYWYHSDHLGSAQLITNVEGEEYERIEYTPYGELWVERASAASNIDIPYRFTGKERDEETGLYYYGARYLDPKTSRWLSTDPALSEYIPGAPINDEAKKRNSNLPGMGGVFNTVNLHLYHYAGNNPVKYKDPTGLFDIVAIYDREMNTFDVYIVGNNSSHTSSKIEDFSASGHVLDRSQTGPVMGTSPAGDDYGTARQFYIPQELPDGTYQLRSPIRFDESDPSYVSLGPAFVPILTTQEVPVYGTTPPVRNPETGLFEPTGTQTDGGYGVHAIMIGNNTTWGCVGTRGEDKIQNAINFADWVQKAIDSGGSANLTIW
jgi:RHS repeat-associated protein